MKDSFFSVPMGRVTFFSSFKCRSPELVSVQSWTFHFAKHFVFLGFLALCSSVEIVWRTKEKGFIDIDRAAFLFMRNTRDRKCHQPSFTFFHVNSEKGIRQMNSKHRKKRRVKKLCNFQGEELQQFVQSTCRHANKREIHCTTSSRRR